MKDLVQDTVFGHLLCWLSKGKYLQYEEFHNPELLEKYLNSARKDSDAQEKQDLQEKLDDSEKSSPHRPEEVEKGVDYELIEFLEDDPMNPQNWSLGKKFFVTFQICLLTTSVYMGSSIYTAGIMDVQRQFGVSQTVALLGLTLFVLGYGVGPMIWAPLSEMPYFGRGTIYIATLAVFVGLQPAVADAPNIGALLAFRFITGFVGGPPLATGGASIADIYAPRKRAYGIAIWGVAAIFGPTLGPIVGSFAAQHKGWKWTIWELLWLSGFCLIFLFFFLPETSSANIIYRRTRRIRKILNDPDRKVKCKPEIDAEGMQAKHMAKMLLVWPFTLNAEPILLALNIYIALVYALLYTWFESFPIVFTGIYGFNLSQEGLSFCGILVGSFLIIPPFFWYLHRYLEPQFNENGELKPELRLYPALVGAFCLPICLFWFGWTSREDIHWASPACATIFFTFGAFLLFQAVLNYLGDAYPQYTASVFAGNDLMRSGFAAGFPLFAHPMYEKLGVGWATSLLGFLSVAFIPIPFLLIKYGEQLRMRSNFARHDL